VSSSSSSKEPWREEALQPVKPILSKVVGSSIGRTGTDVTATTVHRSCLVLAPHPDDETLGCGATIMRKVDASIPVHVLVLSDGSTWPPGRDPADNISTRDAELRSACKLLGLEADDVSHLAFPEQGLEQVPNELVDSVADAVRQRRPQEVLTTSDADPHPDHAALGAAARRALAGRQVRLLAYPVWQWDHPRSWLRTLRASSRPEVVRTSGYLERKRAAVAVYRSQLSAASGGDLTGGYGLSPRFLHRFLGPYEMFFPIPEGASR
jgi:LmbE family N-acetylglucosaminyl deacetylase